jgi:cobyrinic acid a,c-diamide synthase
MIGKGIVIAAPSSASGKTLVSFGLMAAFSRRSLAVRSAKVGPDYIDPAFHSAATGKPGATLDGWAMPPTLLASRIARISNGCDLVICEGVMGLLDGADVDPGERDGSTLQIATASGWPVILVVDAARMAGSAAAIVAGFSGVAAAGLVKGVIFNRVGSARHRGMIERSMAVHCPHVEILGFLPYAEALVVPSRHLGLVQAVEHPDLKAFVDQAATLVADHVDLDRVEALAHGAVLEESKAVALRPLGQRIAVAQDQAFAFVYDDILLDWQGQGASLSFFSPLADQPPSSDCDAVYLPGGYPELSAELLAHNETFKTGIRQAADRGAFVFGECGGYMVLGDSLIDKSGVTHSMIGVLPVVTSMQNPKRHLGYRRAVLETDTPFGRKGDKFRGHEFHYAVELTDFRHPLFSSSLANDGDLCTAGYINRTVAGSFIHLISAEGIIS